MLSRLAFVSRRVASQTRSTLKASPMVRCMATKGGKDDKTGIYTTVSPPKESESKPKAAVAAEENEGDDDAEPGDDAVGPDGKVAYTYNSVMFPPSKLKEASGDSFGKNGKYASVLFRIAITDGDSVLKKVQADLADFMKVLEGTTEVKLTLPKTAGSDEADGVEEPIRVIVDDKSMSIQDKLAVVNSICTAQSYNPIVLGFLTTLIENNRIHHIDNVIERFNALCVSHAGSITATISSASALSAEQKKKAESILKKRATEENPSITTINFEYVVDPSLIGGLVFELGDEFLDLSLRNKLESKKEVVSDTILGAHENAVKAAEAAALKAAGITATQKANHDAETIKLDAIEKLNQTDKSVAEYIASYKALHTKIESVKAAGGWAKKHPIHVLMK